MPLRKLSVREIQSRPARSLLTLLSIVIGVAAIVATSLASTSAQLAQMAMVRAVTGNASLEIQGAGSLSFDGKPLEPIASLPGVAVASPILRRYSNMTLSGVANSTSDEPKAPTRFRVQLLGVLPTLDKQVRSYQLVEGVGLEQFEGNTPGVLMDVSFAKSTNVKVGSEVRFLTKSSLQPKAATVVGLIKPNDTSAALQSGLIVAELTTVQRWSRATGKLDAIQIVLDKGAKMEAVRDAIQAQLPEGLNVREPTLRSQVANESTIAPQQGLRLATLFALVISTLMIYNTFQMNVGERRRQLGILRSLGGTRKQLLLMIVREGLWLGSIGSVLGCVLGYFGDSILRKSTAQLLEIEIPPSPFSIWPYLIAALCGVAISFIGAFFPAFRASRLSPSEAMRVVATGEFGSSRVGWIGFGGTLI
ncbi:MAG: ABC transporter permease, partial [Pirellula staleyi]